MQWALMLTHPELLYTNASWSLKFILSSIFHIALLFILLGICASDYLCPNVTNIVELRQRSSTRHLASSTSSNIIKISSNASTGVIMAILLSWCNSSPDLFSNFISWTSATETNLTVISLSIGEVLGACGIILCIVEGTIIIIMSSIKLQLTRGQKYSILRDLIMVMIAMLLMTYIVLQNKITLMNCLFMLFIYCFYIYLKFSRRHSYHGNPLKNIYSNASSNILEQDNSIIENEIIITDTDLSNDDNNNINNINQEGSQYPIASDLEETGSGFELDDDDTELRTGIKQSLISAMDFNNLLNMLENSSTSSTNLQKLGHEMVNIDNSSAIVLSVDNLTVPRQHPRALSEPIYYTDHPPNGYNAGEDPGRSELHSAPTAFSPYHDNPNTIEAQVSHLEEIQQEQSRWKSHLYRSKKYKTLLCQILTPHLLNFKQKTKMDAILSLLTTPFVLILQLSCPRLIDLLEYDDYTTQYSLPIIKSVILWLQALITPLMTMTLIACLCSLTKVNWTMWIITTVVIVTLMIILSHFHRELFLHNKFSLLKVNTSIDEIELKNIERRKLESYQTILNMIFLSMGILNSILFISLIANALIELMELYQVLTGISKAILGLTIFAWGNSLSDLLTNIAMCRLYLKVPNKEHIEMVATKFFVISFQSCLGGVMLNSMVGIGLSGLITMCRLYSGDTKWWFLRYIEFQDTNDDDPPKRSYQFIVSCLVILAQTIVLLNLINGAKLFERLSSKNIRLIGFGMCGLWGIATLINVSLEVFG